MLTELFKTKERLKILYYITYQKSFVVNQVSKETAVTKGLVSRYLNYPNATRLLNRSGHSHCPDGDAHNASVDGRAVTRAVKVLLNRDKLNIGSWDSGWAAGIGMSDRKRLYLKIREGLLCSGVPRFSMWLKELRCRWTWLALPTQTPLEKE